jgi:hypothetical protein
LTAADSERSRFDLDLDRLRFDFAGFFSSAAESAFCSAVDPAATPVGDWMGGCAVAWSLLLA